jgi:hypothetical protein
MIIAEADTLIPYFIKNKKYFVQNDLFLDGCRTIGWGIVKLLKKLADVVQTLFEKAFSLINVTTWNTSNDFLKELQPLAVAVVCISLLAIGMMLMFKNEKLSINPIVSMLLFFMVAGSGTVIISDLNTTLELGKKALEGSQSTSSSVIIKDHMYDLLYIDKEQGLINLANDEPKKYDSLSDEQIELINIKEVINPNSSYLTTDEGRNILGKYLFFINSGATNEERIEDVYNGIGWNSKDDADLFNQFYYRYKVEYGQIIISLIIIVLIYLCASLKTVQLIYNIFASEVIAVVFSGELSNNTKVKKILLGIRDSYIALLLVVLNIRLYLFFQAFLTENFAETPLVKVLLELLVAIAVIDGPNVMEIISGRDVGMKSGIGMIAGAAFGARMAKADIDSKIRTAGTIGQKIKSGISKMSGGTGSTQGADGKEKNMPGAAKGDAAHMKSGQENKTGEQEQNAKNQQMQNAAGKAMKTGAVHNDKGNAAETRKMPGEDRENTSAGNNGAELNLDPLNESEDKNAGIAKGIEGEENQEKSNLGASGTMDEETKNDPQKQAMDGMKNYIDKKDGIKAASGQKKGSATGMAGERNQSSHMPSDSGMSVPGRESASGMPGESSQSNHMPSDSGMGTTGREEDFHKKENKNPSTSALGGFTNQGIKESGREKTNREENIKKGNRMDNTNIRRADNRQNRERK